MKKNQYPVSEHLAEVYIGIPRYSGAKRKRTIAELLAEAEERGGVYGGDNKSVDSEMSVPNLLRWHCDFDWEGEK